MVALTLLCFTFLIFLFICTASDRIILLFDTHMFLIGILLMLWLPSQRHYLSYTVVDENVDKISVKDNTSALSFRFIVNVSRICGTFMQ